MSDNKNLDRYYSSLDITQLTQEVNTELITSMKWVGPSDFSYESMLDISVKNPDAHEVFDMVTDRIKALYRFDDVEIMAEHKSLTGVEHANPDYKHIDIKVASAWIKTPDFVFKLHVATDSSFHMEPHSKVMTTGSGFSVKGREAWLQICEGLNEKISQTEVKDHEGHPIISFNFITLTRDNMGNIQSYNDVISSNDLLESKSYMYPFIDTELMYDVYREGTENVLVLSGASGTGKTSLARRIILELGRRTKKEEEDKSKALWAPRASNMSVVYIKDEDILKDDAVYAQLQTIKPMAILLDDMDQGLQPRFLEDMSDQVKEQVMRSNKTAVNSAQANHNVTMNKLLSYSDGAIKHKTRILITTNRGVEKGNIEPALIRKGRCLEVLDVPELSYDEALEIWTTNFNRPANGFTELFGDAEQSPTICQAELKREADLWAKVGKRSFLKRQDISIRDKIGGGRVSRARRDEYNEQLSFENKRPNSSGYHAPSPGVQTPIGEGWASKKH